MDVSGGKVTIRESTAQADGGRGGVGRFLGLGTGGQGMPPKKWYAEASWALQFWGGGFLRVQGLRGLQADATDWSAKQVISNV